MDTNEHNDKVDLVDVELLSVKEAAQVLSVSASILYGLMQRGEIQYVPIGRARRIRRSVLRKFIESRETGGWLDTNGNGQPDSISGAHSETS